MADRPTKDWEDLPSRTTPLDAAALEDADTRGFDYSDAVVEEHNEATTSVHGITDTANLIVEGDARLSNARTPIDGSVTAAKVAGSLKPSSSAAAGDEALRALGTSSSTAAAGDHTHTTLPSSGQKDGLAGTSGTPSSGNPYATKATTDGLQPLDATLTALAGLATGANKLAYSTGTDTFTQTDLTSAGRALRDDADATAQRTTLNVYSKAEIDFSLAFKRNATNTVTTYMPVPVHMAAPTVSANPFSNNVPGWQLAQTGFSVIDGGIVIPADCVDGNAMKVRLCVASASSGNVRLQGELLKVADAGSITAAATAGTAQTVALSANTLKVVDLANATTATAGSYLHVRAYRDGDNAGDTLGANAFLMAIGLVYDATV